MFTSITNWLFNPFYYNLIFLIIFLIFLLLENSFLILPAVIILGLIGVPLRIANMQIADYYPRKRSTVITVFSGAFSASPVVFVLCKYAYDHLQLSYQTVMSAPLLLSFLMLPTTFYYLPKQSVRAREAKMWQRWEQYRRALGLEKLEDENQMPDSVMNQKPRCIAKHKLGPLLEEAKMQQEMKDVNADEKMKKTKSGSILDLYLTKKDGGKFDDSEEQKSFLDNSGLGNDSGLASEMSVSDNNNNNNNKNGSSSVLKSAIIVPKGELR